MERRASSPAETGTRRFPKFVQVWPGETPVSPHVVESPFVLAGGPLLATLFLQGEDFLGENFGERLLSALQSCTGSGRQVGRGVHVRPNRGRPAAPEINFAAHLLLLAVLGVAGHGAGSRRSAQYRGLADDS